MKTISVAAVYDRRLQIFNNFGARRAPLQRRIVSYHTDSVARVSSPATPTFAIRNGDEDIAAIEGRLAQSNQRADGSLLKLDKAFQVAPAVILSGSEESRHLSEM